MAGEHHALGLRLAVTARREAALEACRLRLRPILMTSFAFILGVVPLAVAAGAGAEMRRALGIAVFSGMLFLIDLVNEARGEEYAFERAFPARRVAVGTAFMVLITVLAANQLNAFIYFRF